ncbi:COP9 signalosome complex subunit 1 [Hypsibius exemplaris]|uniref:COP9 signalosome complex subunit 1 n=1 Tax=Hypsibius exemplaris TaxID=2072580 RepID=A0A1W0XE34_HYPEX|nr:COP9 signalosome complex subunit 1 [Hypsibius exemplaris]
MSGFADEGVSFDEEDGMNGGGGGPDVFIQLMQQQQHHQNGGNHSNANGFGGLPPDIIMGDDNGEYDYPMEIQEAMHAGRSAGNLDDFGGGFLRGIINPFRNTQREAEPQRVAPVEMNFTVDTAAVDLDTHVGNHQGIIKTQRLLHVAKHCPPLRVDALKMALKNIQKTSEVALYTKVHEDLKSSLASGLKGEDGDSVLPKLDDVWVRETKKIHDSKMEKLEHDLKNYKANSIKESIRRGFDDIGYHFLAAGDANNALKAFNSSRDYAEGLKEQAHMLSNRLKACVYLQHFPNPNQLQENMRDIEAGLERISAGLVKDAKLKDAKEKEGGIVAGPSVVATDSQLDRSWNLIKACMALYQMSAGEYTKAADLFVSLNPESCDFPDVIVGRDIAQYGALCALARYDRQTLKEKVLSNKGFKSFLETAPEVRRMVEKFYTSQFGEFLGSFNEHRNQLMLDLLLAPHVDGLLAQTRTHGMIEFFRCYDSVKLEDMSREFCYTPAELHEELVKLILSGRLPARIDSLNQNLNRDTPDVFMESALKVKQNVDQLKIDLHVAILRSNLARHGFSIRGKDDRGEIFL